MNIEIQGMETIVDKLDDLVSTERVMAALGKACALVEAEAKKKAPKDNGDLRRSITSKVETKGTEIVGTVFTPLEYAPYIMCGA